MRRPLLLLGTLAFAACEDGPTTPEPTFEIEGVSGGGQVGVGGWTLMEPLTVAVTAPNGTPAVAVLATFRVASGGGSVAQQSVLTQFDGTATTRWSLGLLAERQQVVASVESGRAPVTFDAFRMSDDSADVVVVHGARGPLRSVVLVRDSMPLEVVGARAFPDTVFPVPPAQAVGSALVVFAQGNRPLRAEVAWTSGRDTVHLALEGPVEIELSVEIQAGDFVFLREHTLALVGWASDVFAREALGVTFGDVTFVDNASSATRIATAGLCAGRYPALRIHALVVAALDNGAYAGWGCISGHVFLDMWAWRFPYILAHEIGHTFTLGHQSWGLMHPSVRDGHLREGEIFRAHFDESSTLNTIFGSQPVDLRRKCSFSGACLPVDLDLVP